MDRQEISRILASAGLRPQHKFGQNFMVDQATLRALADAGGIEPGDIVLEVGPGVGNLTRLLAQRVRTGVVLAVDIDRKLMPAAQRHHAALTNVRWLSGDVLAGKHEINPEVVSALRELGAAHPRGALRLVSNLPYNAASPLVAELLVLMCMDQKAVSPAHRISFAKFAFTVQWEVAERMRAKPDTTDYGPLGILIQLMADVQVIRKIPPGVFWPPPKVHSALVVVTPRVGKMALVGAPVPLQQLLAGVFSHRRQTLHNALRHYLAERYTPELQGQISTHKIDVKLRPENLATGQFLTLAQLTAPLYHAGATSEE